MRPQTAFARLSSASRAGRIEPNRKCPAGNSILTSTLYNSFDDPPICAAMLQSIATFPDCISGSGI